LLLEADFLKQQLIKPLIAQVSVFRYRDICKLVGISEEIHRDFGGVFQSARLKNPSKFLYLVQEEHFDTL